MSALRRSIVSIPLACLFVVALIFSVFQIVHAQTNIAVATDAMCITMCAQAAAQKKPCPAPTVITCGTSVGGPVTGICMPTGCQALTAAGLGGSGNAMGSMGQLAQTIGQLLGQLMQGAGGGGSGGSGSTGTTGVCTTSYFTESTDPNLPLSNPCAQYIPPTNLTCPVGETGTYPSCTLSTGNTGSTCSLSQELAGTCPSTSGSGTDTTNGTITPTPNSGPAPLAVTFTITDNSGSCPHSPIVLSPGDGTASQTVFDGAATDCVIGATQTIPHTYQQAGTYTASLSNQSTGGTLQQSSVIVTSSNTNTTDSTNGTLTPTPDSGPAPLTVSITATDTSGSCPHSSIMLSFGDGTQDQTVFGGASSTCQIQGTNVLSHTYQSAGNYTLVLYNGSTSFAFQKSVIIATGSNSSGTSYYTNGGSGGAPGVASITGTFTMAAPVGASTSAPYSQGNVSGSIVTTGNGGTFTANSSNGNTEVAGFFGGNTVVGAVSSLVTNWCQTRPWTTNFLAAIFPPAFFDGLCSWAGYGVGAPAAQATTPQVTLTQSSTPTKQTTPSRPAVTPPASSTTLTVVPKVDIWAVPASVALGSRATIYWNTQGVSNCTESSPDGSFNANTLSGGANTVPLTESTTYTISCVDTQGGPQTAYVTVGIAL